MQDSSIILEIRNKNYSGWNKATIVRTMESMAGSFNITLINEKGEEINEIQKGDPCKLIIKDSKQREITMITGYVDDRRRSKSGTNTAFSITGRDITSYLVDCSAIFPPSNTWRSKSISQIAKDLCDPFDIEVENISASSDPFKEITVQSGETVFSIIERLCRIRGVLPITSSEGKLLLTHSVTSQSEPIQDLVDSESILRLDETDSLRDQFSEYTVKGQSGGGGLAWQDSTTTSLKGVATDKSVPRYRPLVLMSEGKATSLSVKERAAWESQVRAGRAREYVATVRGWMQDPGTPNNPPVPWEPNTLVNLISEEWDLREKRLITTVEFSIDNNEGRITTLTLKHPDTYKANPNPDVDL